MRKGLCTRLQQSAWWFVCRAVQVVQAHLMSRMCSLTTAWVAGPRRAYVKASVLGHVHVSSAVSPVPYPCRGPYQGNVQRAQHVPRGVHWAVGLGPVAHPCVGARTHLCDVCLDQIQSCMALELHLERSRLHESAQSVGAGSGGGQALHHHPPLHIPTVHAMPMEGGTIPNGRVPAIPTKQMLSAREHESPTGLGLREQKSGDQKWHKEIYPPVHFIISHSINFAAGGEGNTHAKKYSNSAWSPGHACKPPPLLISHA